MASLSLTCLASFISSILIMIPPTTAIVRTQAAAPPTPAASLIMNGFSPRPTNPPGSNGIPRELLRRADIQFPAPDNWCGFIEGDYDRPLVCTNTRYTCIFTGSVAVGCCLSLNGACSSLITACMDNTANWAPYRTDSSRLICSTQSLPYCASMVFPQGQKYFFCATASTTTSIELLNDFYYTAIGSTVGPSSADPSITPTRRSSTADPTSTTSQNPTSNVNTIQITSTPAKKSIGTGAIAGIGAGVGILLLAAIAGIIFCVYKRKRKQNPVTPAQQAQANLNNNNTPMQQQGNMAPPYQNGSQPTMAPPYKNPPQPSMAPPYQNPSQPNAQYPNSAIMPFSNDSKSPYENTRASSYGQPSPIASPLLVHGDPNNRASTVSAPLSHNPSLVGNMRSHSPNPLPMTGGAADIQRVNSPDYYKHATGSVSEVDGSGLQQPQPQIYEAASVPVYGGGGGGGGGAAAQELGQGQGLQYPPAAGAALNTQLSHAGQAQAQAQTVLPPQVVHEAPAQQEPKYVPYNPGIATPPPPPLRQQHQQQQPGPQGGAPIGGQRGSVAPPSAGPWEIGS